MIKDAMSQTQGDAPPAGRLTAPPLPRLAALAVYGALVVPSGKPAHDRQARTVVQFNT
jgi:hypothetical protein